LNAVPFLTKIQDVFDTVIEFKGDKHFSRPVVPKVGGTVLQGGGEAEMEGWGAIGDSVNNYISVVLLNLSD